jgi:spermidine synthase
VLEKLLDAGLSLPLAIGVTAAALLLLPIYLASQTVPLLAELINTEGKAGKASGRILFYSTLGSVAGGIVTPVWLFPSIGVIRSGYAVCALLALIAAALAFSTSRLAAAASAGIAVASFAGALATPSNALYSFDSAYQSIRIVEEKAAEGRPARVLIMSGSRSSGIYADTGETFFEYVRAAERAFEEAPAEQALVIGAAGFTFPRDAARLARVKRIDAVDVDPVVKEVAERHFLQRPLSSKIRFLPMSARYALRRLRADGVHYGFAFVDAYFAKGIPEELTTAEFFQDVRSIADRTAANVVMDRDMESPFARNLLATFREAFGSVWTRDVVPGDDELTNVLVTNWPAQGSARWNGSGAVYRDDRNSSDRDHVEMIW